MNKAAPFLVLLAISMGPGPFAQTARGYMNLGDRIDYGQKDHEEKHRTLAELGGAARIPLPIIGMTGRETTGSFSDD